MALILILLYFIILGTFGCMSGRFGGRTIPKPPEHLRPKRKVTKNLTIHSNKNKDVRN